MKIFYYFRHSAPGNYSIENVFNTIISHLQSEIDIKVYKVRKPLDLISALKFSRHTPDVYHITGAENYLAFFFPRRKTILTVHDIGHLTVTLKGWKKLLYKYLYWELPLKSARYIVSISEFTKNQLLQNFQLDANRIIVIPNPVNEIFNYRPATKKSKPIILQIGSGKNKNVDRLVEACRGLDVKLLLVRKRDDKLIEKLEASDIDYEFRTDLTLDQVYQAYIDADIVFFASTYEGFGLPIIEAMSVGRPVITSDLSPMKEIAEGAALLVDPYSAGEIRMKINELVHSPLLCDSLVQRGIVIAQRYKGASVAQEYLTVYEQLIDARAE